MSLQDRVQDSKPGNNSKQTFGEIVVMGIRDKLKPLFKEEDDFKEFARSIATVLDSDPTAKHPFHKCSIENIHRAIMKCATYNLIPNLYDYCFLIAYNQTCKFEFGYMGLVELSMRTGRFKDMFAQVVFEKDKIDIDLANGKITHRPNLIDRGKMIACYAVADFVNGIRRIEVMGLDDFNKIKALSRSQDVVKKWESEFFRKSTLKRLQKSLPMSKEDRSVIVKGEDEPIDSEFTHDDIIEEEQAPEPAKPKVQEIFDEAIKEEKPIVVEAKEVVEKKYPTNKRDAEKEMEKQVKQNEEEEKEKMKSMVDDEDPFADDPFQVGEY